jgi:hypothetical protein
VGLSSRQAAQICRPCCEIISHLRPVSRLLYAMVSWVLNILEDGACMTIRIQLQACIWGFLLWLHPKPLQHTPTYTWTVTFAGVCCGFALGLRGHVPLNGCPLPEVSRGAWWPLGVVGAALWRVLLGAHLARPVCLVDSRQLSAQKVKTGFESVDVFQDGSLKTTRARNACEGWSR